MGDEGIADVPSPPAAKRLKRVAEVVMVLSAMAEMRGGRDPTPVEKAMAAEARETLTGLCEGFKPKDLFSREAVRAVVEDLGLNKDAGIGFKPPKVSIAERILLTKRKVGFWICFVDQVFCRLLYCNSREYLKLLICLGICWVKIWA